MQSNEFLMQTCTAQDALHDIENAWRAHLAVLDKFEDCASHQRKVHEKSRWGAIDLYTSRNYLSFAYSLKTAAASPHTLWRRRRSIALITVDSVAVTAALRELSFRSASSPKNPPAA